VRSQRQPPIIGSAVTRPGAVHIAATPERWLLTRARGTPRRSALWATGQQPRGARPGAVREQLQKAGASPFLPGTLSRNALLHTFPVGLSVPSGARQPGVGSGLAGLACLAAPVAAHRQRSPDTTPGAATVDGVSRGGRSPPLWAVVRRRGSAWRGRGDRRRPGRRGGGRLRR
jgi:hypothetical protein